MPFFQFHKDNSTIIEEDVEKGLSIDYF